MRLPERLPLLVCTVPLLLYAATLSANFNFDGTVFALLLRQSLAVGSPFSHLHFQHLLYGPATFLFARPLPVDPLRALQLFGWGVTELSLLLFLLPSLLPRCLPTWPPIAPRFAKCEEPGATLRGLPTLYIKMPQRRASPFERPRAIYAARNELRPRLLSPRVHAMLVGLPCRSHSAHHQG